MEECNESLHRRAWREERRTVARTHSRESPDRMVLNTVSSDDSASPTPPRGSLCDRIKRNLDSYPGLEGKLHSVLRPTLFVKYCHEDWGDHLPPTVRGLLDPQVPGWMMWPMARREIYEDQQVEARLEYRRYGSPLHGRLVGTGPEGQQYIAYQPHRRRQCPRDL